MNPLRAPLYFLLALTACAYLAAANLRGWTIFQPLVVGGARAHLPATRHK